MEEEEAAEEDPARSSRSRRSLGTREAESHSCADKKGMVVRDPGGGFS